LRGGRGGAASETALRWTSGARMHPDIEVIAIAIAVAALVFGACRAGVLLAQRHLADDVTGPELGVVQGAAFGILSLLLAFSFSTGLSRYDARRVTVVKEANAIGTTWLRAQILAPAAAKALRADLKTYADDRIQFLAAEAVDDRAQAAARSAALQQQMWGLVMTADPRVPATNLIVQTMNDTIDVSTEQAELLGARIPRTVFILLIVTALIAGALLGAGYGREKRHGIPVQITLAVLLAIVIAVILDLDAPTNGIIRVDITPLRDVRASLDR